MRGALQGPPPEYVLPMRGVLLSSPFFPCPRVCLSNARGVSEGCFPRAQGCFCIRGCSACWCNASGALPRRRGPMNDEGMDSRMRGNDNERGKDPAQEEMAHQILSIRRSREGGNLRVEPGLDFPCVAMTKWRKGSISISCHTPCRRLYYCPLQLQRTILRAVRPLVQAMAYSRQGTVGNGRASHCGKEKQ